MNSVRRVNTDVTCMKVLGSGELGEGAVVCTTGRDGKVVMLDPRTGAKVGEAASGEWSFDVVRVWIYGLAFLS